MTDEKLREKWDRRYDRALQPSPALAVLIENAHLLPARGTALDLACGLGGSALYLAELGLETWAWDLSPVAIDLLRGRSAGPLLHAESRDVIARPPEPGRFDVICVGQFLERGLCDRIAVALKPGGLLFYQTFTRETVDDSGPGNPDYRLGTNELLELFAGLTIRFYRDEGRLGDHSRGLRNRAQLVAQRPL
jgi:SAM-dependent methyltransferase